MGPEWVDIGPSRVATHETYVEGEEYPFSQNYTSQYNVVSQGKAPMSMMRSARMPTAGNQTEQKIKIHYSE